jgi:hypothetical protein
MIAWHLGGAVFLFRWIFRDPKADLRPLVLGVLIPDLVDLSLGMVLFEAPEALFHTLLAPAVCLGLVLILTRRGSARRAWVTFTIGWFFHLLLDGMWADGRVFWWPMFGVAFSSGSSPLEPGLVGRVFSDPWLVAREALGLGYLLWLWRRYRVGRPENRRALLSTGRLP